MFSSKPNYGTLKTNLRLAVSRLKLIEKKKTELALKARKEIADYIGDKKAERAKIRVEHIIREDYLVEAMELVEMYCDLLLARFGLLQQMKELDEGLAEAISSIIWVAPRLVTDISEMKIIGDQLSIKYGKLYAQSCSDNSIGTVSEKLMQKLSVHAPPKALVEKYLIEIARMYNVNYEPDIKVLNEEHKEDLINIGEDDDDINNLGGGNQSPGVGGGGGGGGMVMPPGFIGYPGMPMPQPPPGAINSNSNPAIHPLNHPPAYPPPPSHHQFNMPNIPNAGPGGYPAFDPLQEQFHLDWDAPAKPSNLNIPPGSGGVGGFINPGNDNDKLLNYNYQKGKGNSIYNKKTSPPPPYSSLNKDKLTPPPSAPINNSPNKDEDKPKPALRKLTPPGPPGSGINNPHSFVDLPDLPTVPSNNLFPGGGSGSGGGGGLGGHQSRKSGPPKNESNEDNEIDFDDLTKRFEELKKRK